MRVVDLADFKRHLNKTSPSTTDDEELQVVLDAASKWVERYIDTPLGGGSATYTAYADNYRLVLPVSRLASVTAITDPFGVDVPVASCYVDLSAGIVILPYTIHLQGYLQYRQNGAWIVSVTLASTVDADVKLAILIIAAHLWSTQRGAGTTPRAAQEALGPPQAGYAVPNRAIELLSGRVLPGIA